MSTPASDYSPPRGDRRFVHCARQRWDFPRLAGLAGLSALLAACSIIDGAPDLPPTGQMVGDEPQAVEVGASVLAHGGNAADAAAASYFALAVTYPVAAGLGGGGICLVYHRAQQQAEEFDFLPRQTSGRGTFAIPGNVAGFALLQATYGRLPWQRIVSPAEGLAATGFSMSPAMHARLDPNQDTIRLDAELAREFLDESGHLKPTGSIATAPALALTLSRIRVEGPGALYDGPIADVLVSYTRVQGGEMTATELSSYRPERNKPMRISIGGETAFLPTEGVVGGQYARALLSRLVDAQGQIIDADHTGAAVAAATSATLAAFKITSLPGDLGTTGFAAIDPSGEAISCEVTMGSPFGSGRTAGNSGVVLATASNSGSGALAPAFVTPAIAASGDVANFAGTGSGGPNATAMVVRALLDIAKGNDLTQPGLLGTTGLEPFETINVIQCKGGVCSTIPDPRAFGLGAAAQ